MQMPLFRIREQSPRSPFPLTAGEGFFIPAVHGNFPQYIVSKSHYNVLRFVLRFYKNKNRKCCISSTCGCFEMVEATGVEPVS